MSTLNISFRDKIRKTSLRRSDSGKRNVWRKCLVCLWWGFKVQSTQWGHVERCFTGQAFPSKRLTSSVHILSPETENSPSWISGRERMIVENISLSIFTKESCRPDGNRTRNLLITTRIRFQLSHRGRRRKCPTTITKHTCTKFET